MSAAILLYLIFIVFNFNIYILSYKKWRLILPFITLQPRDAHMNISLQAMPEERVSESLGLLALLYPQHY